MQSHLFIRIMLSVCLGLCFSVSVQAKTWGWLEGIYLVGVDKRLRAKLDTGALTSSIHGIVKDRFERNGEDWVRFEFTWYKKSNKEWIGPYIIEAPLVRKVKIKDHEDEAQKRLVVYLNFSIDNNCYSGEFSIADRSGFNYPVLIGRRFLSGRAVIDPSRSFTKATVNPNENDACQSLDQKSGDFEKLQVIEKIHPGKTKDRLKEQMLEKL